MDVYIEFLNYMHYMALHYNKARPVCMMDYYLAVFNFPFLPLTELFQWVKQVSL